VTYAIISHNRQPSPWIGIKHFVLTFCGCGLIIFIYNNILLGFLVPLVYIKRKREDVTNEEDVSNEENKKQTNEELEDMTRIKDKIKDLTDRGVINRVETGLPVPHKDFKDLQDIKQEFGSYFDEDSGNNLEKGLEEVGDYLAEEIASLSINNPSEGSSTPLDDSKKRKLDDSTDLPVEMPSIFDDVD
jgi:hypothetical protein